jgi:DMSO/TMAO reductase YedYZ molybdopterin-dependent catalytic subunit
MDDILRFPSVSRIHFLECSGNSSREWRKPFGKTVQVTHGLISCCEWTGVLLSTVLQETGLLKGASWVLPEGADACALSRSVPIEKCFEDAMLVYGQNGEMLRPQQGYPLRLFLPGFEGNMNVKWLRRLKVGSAPFMTREETSKYTDSMPDGSARQFTFIMEAKSVMGAWAAVFLAADPSIESQRVAAFVQRLRELAWIDGRNLAIEYRWAEGRNERYAESAAEFVRLKVDVIVTVATPATLAARQATMVIPIVFAAASDPVGTGLVASLARPGGNITGLANQISDTGGKKLELLREVVPGLRRLAIKLMWAIPPPYWTWAKPRQRLARSALRSPHPKSGERGTSRPPSTRSWVARMHCMSVSTRSLTPTVFASIPWRWPRDCQRCTVFGSTSKRGLMSYGPNLPDLFRRAADFVDKILRGAKPGEIPVEQPTKFDLIINLTTAKALGLNVPPSLIARADEVIE